MRNFIKQLFRQNPRRIRRENNRRIGVLKMQENKRSWKKEKRPAKNRKVIRPESKRRKKEKNA